MGLEKKSCTAWLITIMVALAIVTFFSASAKSDRSIVVTERAPRPIGPYSQAVMAGRYLFISGQLGIDPVTHAMPGEVAAQARQAMANLQAILQAAGLDFSQVVQTRIFLKDMADFQAVNEVYASYFKGDFPARATVQVAALPKEGKVEIEMVAFR